jgi:hypothetical protein
MKKKFRTFAEAMAASDAAAADAERYAGMMLGHATPEQREWWMDYVRKRLEEVRAENRAWPAKAYRERKH